MIRINTQQHHQLAVMSTKVTQNISVNNQKSVRDYQLPAYV